MAEGTSISRRLFVAMAAGAACSALQTQAWADTADNLATEISGEALQTQGNYSKGRTVADGIYRITPKLSSSYNVSIAKASTANCVNVQLGAADTAKLMQKFIVTYDKTTGYYAIKNAWSGKMLAVQNASTASGANVLQYGTTASTLARRWAIIKLSDGSYRIRSALSGRSLAVAGSTAKAGANICVKASSNVKAQKWMLSATHAVQSGTVAVLTSALGKRAEVANGALRTGCNVRTDAAKNSFTQKFTFNRVSGNLYRIVSLASGLAVTSYKNNAQLAKVSTNKAQLWKIWPAAGGYVTIRNAYTGKRLNVYAGSTSNYANVNVATAANAKRQWWKVTATTSTCDTYLPYSITLKQMLNYQMDYYSTDDRPDVFAALDPSVVLVSHPNEFVNLNAYSGLSAAQVNAFISSTSTGQGGVLAGHGAAFVNASKTYGLNEAYFVAHAVLESGWGTSDLACGYYYDGTTEIEGQTYPAGTYYNFFGIGAYDSSPLSGGRSMAIQNGWNSIDAAITGAAEWIAKYYIHTDEYPQTTLYDMKWDSRRSNATWARGWHQYATSLTWASSIAGLMDDVYESAGVSVKLARTMPKYC